MPPQNLLSGDTLFINNGSFVLDQNLTCNGAAIFLKGIVTATSGYYVSLSGSGFYLEAQSYSSISVDSLYIDADTIQLQSNATLNLKKLTCKRLVLATGGSIVVKEKTFFVADTFTLINGSIEMRGSVIVDGGTFLRDPMSGIHITNFADSLYYIGDKSSIGSELYNNSYKDIFLNPGIGNVLTAVGNVKFNTKVHLLSGVMNLNGYNLFFDEYCESADTGNLLIRSDSRSVITAHGKKGFFKKRLTFEPSADTVRDFVVNNFPDTVFVGSDFTIMRQLYFYGYLNIGAHTLYLSPISIVQGPAGYTITDGGGKVSVENELGSNIYRIGTTEKYAPLAIIDTSKTHKEIAVGVRNGVTLNGDHGNLLSDTQPCVEYTWYIDAAFSNNVQMLAYPYWTNDMEVNGFDRTKSNLATYSNNIWNIGLLDTAYGGRLGTPANLYSAGGAIISGDAYYAIFDSSANLKVSTLANTKLIDIFPNPVTGDEIYVNSKVATKVLIYNILGVVSLEANLLLGLNTLNIQNLNSGVYVIECNVEGNRSIQKFIKN